MQYLPFGGGGIRGRYWGGGAQDGGGAEEGTAEVGGDGVTEPGGEGARGLIEGGGGRVGGGGAGMGTPEPAPRST